MRAIPRTVLFALAVIFSAALFCAAAREDPGAEVRFRNIKIRELRSEQEIDQARIRAIRMKQRRDQSLTDEEAAYLQRAEELRRKRNEAFRQENPPRESTGLAPLNELGNNTYKGFEGGLYPGGASEPPRPHLQAGLELARKIVPRDRQGRPAAGGKIVLISVGMSNTTQEFRAFQELAASDSEINPRLVIVDGAQGGQAAAVTADPQARFWNVLEERLSQAGVTPEQVQAAWVKQAIANPSRSFPGEAKLLQEYLRSTVHNLKKRFPNLQIAYLSSRIYAGFTETPLNPEPHAYESGFSVKWLIADQVAGKPELNFDPAKGPVRAPWLAWGPYLWSDGTKGRDDGLVYAREDLAADGTHPSPAGRKKVAGQLMAFLKSAPTARSWFLENPERPAESGRSQNASEASSWYAVQQYYQTNQKILQEIMGLERENLERAAQWMAESMREGRLVHVFGTGGHNIMAAMEIFKRAGSLVPINPLFPPGISVTEAHPNTERLVGYAKLALVHYNAQPGDVILVINVNGINSVTIDAAVEAKKMGLKVITVSSRQFSEGVPPGTISRHPSNQDLHELGDLHIDSHVPLGDAVVEIENFSQKVSSASTMANTFIVQSLVAMTVDKLVKMGVEPEVWASANVQGGTENNRKFREKYRGRIYHLSFY